jgi:two-component system KDP operon response regulator KdpE
LERPVPAPALRHVLLIEDDPATARFVSLVLVGTQFRITICRNWEEACAFLDKDPPDVVLIDLAPQSAAAGQLSLVSELRIPVVILTDIDDEALLVECLQAGVFDIAIKPIAPEDLEACVALAAGTDVTRPSDLPALKNNALELDFAALQATRAGTRQPLSLTEWRFLEALASRAGQTVLYQEIMRNTYGPAYREHLRLAQAWAARLSKKVGLAEFLGLGYALVT